ncbi:MAG TPA: hypothetical protein DIW47_07130 [Bacteroidetes bacterium]|nr:hypothetical protein [Bacteroidota bacterium]
MKFLKRTLFTILLLTAVGILFRGWIYRQLITYKSAGIRTNYAATDDKLVALIHEKAENQNNPDIQQIIKLGLSITSGHLRFTTEKNELDPNKLIRSKTAHCVGYASFFATTCNELLEKYKLSDQWTAKPQVGELFLFGYNIHSLFNSSFFKDHDFVTIENKTTSEIFAVDPTIHDYLWIDFISFER